MLQKAEEPKKSEPKQEQTTVKAENKGKGKVRRINFIVPLASLARHAPV